jgi:hypothetical protein
MHKLTSDQYRRRHGLEADYSLESKEPPAPESAIPGVHKHVKTFRFGNSGGLTCAFEFTLPEFSLAMIRESNRKTWDKIGEVRDFCRYTDTDVWVSIREFQASVILETGRGEKFQLVVFQFSTPSGLAMCRITFPELW